MLLIFCLSCLFTTLTCDESQSQDNPSDWRTIEALAEEHPYMVAILNHEKVYTCSGIVIDKRTILSSGSCLIPDPNYVAVGAAVLYSQLNGHNILKVAFTKIHNDYIFDIIENEYNISRMHSNIGLVFTVRPIPEYYFVDAVFSNHYASELKEKLLFVVGYGNLGNSEALVLQQQAYLQAGCRNPKWYYCVCGIELSPTSYVEPFGEGGPALYDNEIVGIAASETGMLTYRPKFNYNIFTVIGPYMKWIENSKSGTIVQFAKNPRSYGTNKRSSTVFLCVILFIKIFL